MSLKDNITGFSIKHYKLAAVLMVIFTVVTAAFIPLIKVDTDPENMLSEEEEVRVFHNATKDKFNLYDIVVVGIVNDKDPQGVFNPKSLAAIKELTDFALALQWPDKHDPNHFEGVIAVDVIAPSVIDDIRQGGPGEIRLDWLMKDAPATQQAADLIKARAMANPILNDSMVSADGKAICLYLPLTGKDISYEVYKALSDEVKKYDGDEQYYITGLPVAEDTFGVEMFIQMAISAPLAMLVIFLLMLMFFRKIVLVISPMIIAMVSVLSTMGLLIGFGFSVHIMSSMIPIFLMPIAVVDSVHILSEFFDRYTPEKGRTQTIKNVMGHLFTPMLYTSLTSAAGFASLALTPIPPVQVFGIYVAIGIMIAWIWTVVFVPAYVMMISEKSLENFGHKASGAGDDSWLRRILSRAGELTYKKAHAIIIVLLLISAIAVYGITQININDNPVKWFSKNHPIRRADTVLNDHFGGTYMAYLILDGDHATEDNNMEYIGEVRGRLMDQAKSKYPDDPNALKIYKNMENLMLGEDYRFGSPKEYLQKLINVADEKAGLADSDFAYDIWDSVIEFFGNEELSLQTFKRPDVLNYVSGLQDALVQSGHAGKSNSVSDIVKKVYMEMYGGDQQYYRIPDSASGIGNCLVQFQGGHRPADLWHFVTYDYNSINVWLQLQSGDNKDMKATAEFVDNYFTENPPPMGIKHHWAGLTYINVVWQEKMVRGMLMSFMGSFLIVFIMMTILFRSALWGAICMIPLTVTIAVIYGLIGLVGKDYDMPVAVLSALTLGMAVDFAIHFLERARESYRQTGSWRASSSVMFGEPARAIARNVLVIAIGFLPLLAAPLMPYKTVGIFLCAIMALSGLITLLILPSLIRIGEKVLFKAEKDPMAKGCNCGLCVSISVAAVLLLTLNLHQYLEIKIGTMSLIAIVVIPITALICGIMSRRKKCKIEKNDDKNLIEKGAEK